MLSNPGEIAPDFEPSVHIDKAHESKANELIHAIRGGNCSSFYPFKLPKASLSPHIVEARIDLNFRLVAAKIRKRESHRRGLFRLFCVCPHDATQKNALHFAAKFGS